VEKTVKQRIDNKVYEQLLSMLKNGIWKSGGKLPSESELCARLQVSRVSVRSALQRLQALGFIEIKRAKGSFVRGVEDIFDFSGFGGNIDLTRKEFQDIHEMRGMLEGASITLLLSRKAMPDLSNFIDAYYGLFKAAKNLDAEEFTRHDLCFHLSLIIVTGNDKFIRMAQIFREDLFRYLKESNKFLLRDHDDEKKIRRHFEDALVFHTELFEAITRRKGRADEIHKRYLERNSERFDHYYNKIGSKERSCLPKTA
jgi:DNA-binding FadR family transcriptional regulator